MLSFDPVFYATDKQTVRFIGNRQGVLYAARFARSKREQDALQGAIGLWVTRDLLLLATWNAESTFAAQINDLHLQVAFAKNLAARPFEVVYGSPGWLMDEDLARAQVLASIG